MSEITLVEAVNQALAYEMQHDPDVLVLGEDVGTNGGVFRATVDLLDKFGKERVLDTPLAESMIAGASIGMAAQGLKPVCELQFMGFVLPAIDQILSHAVRMRNRTRGRLSCPMVIRTPFGGGIRAPEHHAESFESFFAHTPGCKVVVASSPARAYGLLLAAIRDPDPVVFMEPMRVYRLVKQQVPDDGVALPLGRAFVLREGSDITLISWGASLQETLQSADELAKLGIHAEVIDVASIKPLDTETLLNSVRKTGRCVIVHEAPKTCGFGSELAAIISEQALYSLVAPVQRVTGYDVQIPYFQLEKSYLPNVARIVDATKQTLELL